MHLSTSKKNTIPTPKNILLISTRQIGDLLLTTPLIHTLCNHYPEAIIDVLVFKGNEGILEGNPYINKTIEVSHKPTFNEYKQSIQCIFKKYDLAITTQAGDRPHIYALIAAKHRIGLIPEVRSHQWWKKLSCAAWQILLNDCDTHTVTQNLLLAECIGLNLSYDITPPNSKESKDFLLNHFNLDTKNLNYVIIHPYPMWQYKLWTLHGWQSLISHFHSLGLHVIISGGNAANELAYCQELAKSFPFMIINLAGKASFSDAAYLLRSAKAYVGMDTAMTHLAAACGTPTLALFGPTNPVKWGPWPKGYHDKKSPWQRYSSQYQQVNNVMLLQGLGECVPCHKAGCNDHNNSHSRCLDALSADRVIDALNTLLENSKKNTNPRKTIPICASS